MFLLTSEYFLEDCISLTKFIPQPPKTRKGSNKDKDKDDEETVGGDDTEENMNLFIDDHYDIGTKHALAKMSEKEISFELIDVSHS